MVYLTPEQRIQQAQAQLEALRAQQAPQQAVQQESEEDRIRRLIQEQLAQMLQQAVPAAVLEPDVVDFNSQLLIAVGSALTEDQQLWLSQDVNRQFIPDFLKTIEGQAITRRFFTSYKQYKEAQCK